MLRSRAARAVVAVGADGGLVAHPRQFEPHQLLQRLLVVGEEESETFVRLGAHGGFSFDAALGGDWPGFLLG